VEQKIKAGVYNASRVSILKRTFYLNKAFAKKSVKIIIV